MSALKNKGSSIAAWPAVILLVAVISISLIFFSAARIKSQNRQVLSDALSTIIRTTQAGLHLWKDGLQADQQALASLPKIRELVELQTGAPEGSSSAERLQGIREVLAPWMRDHGYLRFAIYVKDRTGRLRPAFRQARDDEAVFGRSSHVIEGALSGRFMLGQPTETADPRFIQAPHLSEITIVTAAPIRNRSGHTIAALAFIVDVFGAFTEITLLGRMGQSGETYVVDSAGRMITRSRFPASNGDSGTDLARRHAFPRIKHEFRNGGSGTDLDGYRDYRGAMVIGAWLWDQDLSLGLVTELDKEEAFHPYQTVQRLIWFMICIVIAGMSCLMLFREARSKNLRIISGLRESNEARKEILAVVSHDLKNPLSALLMTNELLLRTLPANSEFTAQRRRLLQRNRIAAEQMRRLITDLLDSAKIEAGKLEIHPSACSADDLLAQALEVLEPIASEKGIRIHCDVSAGMPPLWADPERVLQVVSNLLGNALKFTGEGGTVSIKAFQVGSEVQLSIADTGPGISNEDLPHLFERYWQSKKTQSIGTGLGLAICKELVTLHGGRIWVESEPGQGAVFHFTLPTQVRPA